MFRNQGLKISALLLSFGASLALTGCGGASAKPKTRGAALSSSGTVIGGSTDNDIPVALPSATPSSTPSTGTPPYSYRVGATGYTSTTVTVYTNQTLKVKFTPGIQDENVAGTGFSPRYSGLGVYIKVGSQESPTPLLYNGLNGGEAETSPVIDYSSSFSKTCAAGDTSCRQSVTITVTKPNYDYWCINFGSYCPWTHVYDTHPWHGTLTVQTDDTDGI